MIGKRIRVLIVDDSVLMREALKTIVSSDPDLEVVGMAKDGHDGVEKALALKPDVITMDLRMPVMSGLDAIEEIMEENPVSIIVVSTMDVNVIVKALGIGAMDFVTVAQDIDAIEKDLIEKIKIASRVKPLRRMRLKSAAIRVKPVSGNGKILKVVAIGISTGGPQAIQVLLSKIPTELSAAILIVQHISEGFIDGLVEWLKLSSAFDIRVAKTGDVIKSGKVFFAPDGYNMYASEGGIIKLKEDTTKHMVHVPSIDEMMKSVAQIYGDNAVGVIMTGMGRDGVGGIKAIKDAGGFTLAQDEATSVVFGMNKAAIDEGCIDRVVSLHEMADEIIGLV